MSTSVVTHPPVTYGVKCSPEKSSEKSALFLGGVGREGCEGRGAGSTAIKRRNLVPSPNYT